MIGFIRWLWRRRRPDFQWKPASIDLYRVDGLWLWSWYFSAYRPDDPRLYVQAGYAWTYRGAMRALNRTLMYGPKSYEG